MRWRGESLMAPAVRRHFVKNRFAFQGREIERWQPYGASHQHSPCIPRLFMCVRPKGNCFAGHTMVISKI